MALLEMAALCWPSVVVHNEEDLQHRKPTGVFLGFVGTDRCVSSGKEQNENNLTIVTRTFQSLYYFLAKISMSWSRLQGVSSFSSQLQHLASLQQFVLPLLASPGTTFQPHYQL